MNPTLSARPRPLLRGRLLALLALLALLLAVVPGLRPAQADSDGTGWLRLAHLSPDTGAVDVTLTSFGKNQAMLTLDDVAYGDVSAYRKVPAGRYVAAMTPSGGSGDGDPVISQAVTVQAGGAYTVAAVGQNAELKGVVLTDDLRTPAAGAAKVRLLQAATVAPAVTVTAVGGPVLAQDAAFGTATGYASIDAAVWTLEVTPGAGSAAAPTRATVTAKPGSVSTIVVLDAPGGQVATKVLVDAAASPQAPKKGTGVNTGGGGTATTFVDGGR